MVIRHPPPCSGRYRVLFYTLTGQLLARLEPYSNALGARSMAWSPDGTLLAVGSYDQCARLISPVNWKPAAVLRHVHPKNQVGQRGEVGVGYSMRMEWLKLGFDVDQWKEKKRAVFQKT